MLAVAAAAAAFAFSPCTVQSVSARCGTIVVPENRARPNGRSIALNVVVIPSVRKTAARDAFVYLVGGPGDAATNAASGAVSMWPGVHQTRDILLVDQRGTGQSNPLDCTTPAKPIGTRAQLRAYVADCLRGQPGDMRQYGTRAAMDDLDAVRAALGYEKLDLYGISYGATAAQVYLERHPRSVRTVVLDGGTAIDIPFYGRFATNAERALDQVAKRCAADDACSRAYPRWRTQFHDLVRAWDAKPRILSGSALAGVIQAMLLDANRAARIPWVVASAAAGRFGPLKGELSNGGPILQLMYWSIWCNEPWVGLGAHGPWHTDFDGYATASVVDHRATCSTLPKRAEPAALWRQHRSTVPLLALAGGADPQDPISNLHLQRTFPNGRAIVVPNYGHGVGQYGCLGALVSIFVARGTVSGLDTTCVDGTPPFVFTLP